MSFRTNGPITARHFLTEKMEHKQFTSDDMNHSPHSNQVFQADRFLKKTNQLNIPDTIMEQCSAELSGDSLKMEVPKVIIESFNNDDKENINNQQIMSNEVLNDSIKIAIDNSFIRQCERKLLNCSNSDDERSNESVNKSLVNNQQLLNISRGKTGLMKIRKFNETISTPPSLLRKEISMLRTEIAEADEFHDLEIQLLKEEKCLNEVDSENYVELFKKYSELMQLYTVLKAEYDEYRRVQETVTRELQSKTADCLESLCSQIEASDNSLNFSGASFVSFNGGIRSSTMMEDISEVEATVMPDVTVLANDPLSITSDVFKTPVQTPLKSVGLTTPILNSTIKKPLMKEVKEIIAKLENTAPLDSEFEIQLLNLETALCDKVKEVEELEQRLFKVEDMSLALQNEFERVGSVYTKENATLKESLSAKTEQLNELTERLFTETISLNPSLRDSLIDVPGQKLLLVFIETIMENCKKIKNEDAMTTIESLQNQLASQEMKLVELEDLKKKFENLGNELSKAEDTIITRDEEIRLLQSHLSNVRQTREDLAAAKLTLSELESRLTLEEAEKKAAESRCIELEATIEDLKREFDIKEKLITDLQEQLSSVGEKSTEIKTENAHLKELCDSLSAQIIETEKIIKSNESELINLKEQLTSADDTIQQVKSQLKLTEEEKSDLENRCKELQETNQNLLIEITATKDLENNPAFESIKTENVSLKEKISECEKAITELKTELDLSKESQEGNSCRVEELEKEIEQLNNEKFSFSKALENVEERQKSLADVLSDVEYDDDLPSERIIKLIANKFQEQSETRETKILSAFVETITKTCKGVQNELIKQFDAKKLKWETQRGVDMSLIENLQEQIKSLTEKSSEHEAKISEISLEKDELLALHESLKKQMEEAEKIISTCNDEIRELKSQENAFQQAKDNLATADEVIEGLKSQLSTTETQKTEIEQKCRELEESKLVLQTEISKKDEIEREINELKTIREAIEKENGVLKQQILESESSVDNLRKTLDEEQKDRELRIKELQNEINLLVKEKEDLREKLEGLEKNNENLVEVISDVQTHLQMSDDVLNKIMTGELENKKIFSETINSLIKSKMEDLRAEKELSAEEKQVALDDLRNVCNNLETKLLEAEKTVAAREEEINNLHSDIKQIEEDFATAKTTISEFESRLSSVETQKTEAESRCQELEQVVEELKREIESKEQTREQLLAQLSDIEEKTSKIESEYIRLKESFEVLDVGKRKLEEAIALRDEEIQDLKSNECEREKKLREDLETKRKLCESLECELSEVKTAVLDREEQIRILKLDLAKAEENFAAAKVSLDELSETKTALLAREEQIQSLQSDLVKAQEDFTAAKLSLTELSETKTALLAREEQIQILQSELAQAQENYSTAKASLTELESRLAILEEQKTDAETRRCELENTIETLNQKIVAAENRENELENEKAKIETENNVLKQSLDALKIEMAETEKAISTREQEINELKSCESQLNSVKESLTSADETILNLKSQLKSIEMEKSEMQNRCTELEENNQNLQVEISNAKNLENNPMYGKIQTENGDLKGRILESEKMMTELKAELEVAKENQMKNISKVAELIREIDELKKENSEFTYALTTIEETQKNLADVLSCPMNDSELPSERITKLIEKTSRLPDPETRETKIVSDFVETITKTCKGVQNELIKKFDNKKIEWETQKDVDIQNLQEQINLLTEQNVQYEKALKEIKEELVAADEAISKLKSQLSTTQIEKVEIEVRCRKLEESTQTLQAEIDNKQMIVKELDELKIVRQEIETENGDLKQRITESEEVIIRLKKSLEIVKEEQIAKETRIKESQTEIDLLKKEKESLTGLTEKLEKLEKNNRNLMDVISEVQTRLDMPEDTLSKVLSGSLESNKMFSEKIEHLINAQLEGLNLENKHLKLGNDNLKEKIKQLTKLIGESANPEEEIPKLNGSHSTSMSLRSKPGRKSDLCVRRLDKLEEINHNLTELITRILTMTEFPDTEKLKLYSVREFPKVMKKVIAHLDSKLKELKEENAQLDEECETYANIIKDLKKEAVTVWKTNKEKTEAMEEEIGRLKEEKNCLEKEKEDLMAKISKMDADCEKLKSSKSEGALHNCTCDTKKVNELKRAILMKEQKLLELQDLEAQASSYKSQIEYLKNALEREKKKIGEEKDKNKKLQNELNEAIKNQKSENKNGEENLVLDELRMRGSISGGIVQEFGDKEKMKKLAKDIGILKELCRARYAEIKRLEAENAALKSHTPKNSNQMDSPIRSRVYNTRSKNPVKDLWKTELSGKENSAV